MGSLRSSSLTPLSRGPSSPSSASMTSGIISSMSGSTPSSYSGRQSTHGMSLLQTAASNFSGRTALYSQGRERSKFESPIGTFDPSEFPCLGSREAAGPNASLSSRSNYVGIIKQPVTEASEFQMSHEDFPALPGPSPPCSSPSSMSSNSASVPAANNAFSSADPVMLGDGGNKCEDNLFTSILSAQDVAVVHSRPPKRGIQTSPDGRVSNIPPSMVTDQYGVIGLLTFIRAAETDSNLVSLALGNDLTTLGLNLNSESHLYPTFGGPWAETPCRPQDIDYNVPFEYLINCTIREKLAPVKLNRYKDDVLFYMFYTNIGDVLQLAAAAELYNRDWRYHKEDKIWITRAPGMMPSEKTAVYERGTYFFFDVHNWRKVLKDFHLEYDKLEDRPSLPCHPAGGAQSSSHCSASSGIASPVVPLTSSSLS